MMFNPTTTVAVLAVALSVGPSAASAQREPADLWDLPRSEWTVENLQTLTAAAERGEAGAQLLLARVYETGFRVLEHNQAEAARWYRAAATSYRAAAERGHADSQHQLAIMYQVGWGVEKQDAEAVRWYRAAAEEGHANSQHQLGFLFATGLYGVERNQAEAARWYRAAAEQGHANSQRELGSRYSYGGGVEENDAEAARWYRAAAQGYRAAVERGEAEAHVSLGDMYSAGHGVEQNEVEAVRWYLSAVEKGAGTAMKAMQRLVTSYLSGEGVARAHVEAGILTAARTMRGIYGAHYGAPALYTLGKRYLSSEHYIPEPDTTEAVRWFRAAAEQGYDEAQATLGGMYALGRGVPKNHTEALRWYRMAAEQGDAERSSLAQRIQNWLGDTYYFGIGVPANYREAARWYRAAAEQGDARAQNNLGVTYNRGEGVLQDYVHAYAWHNLAAAQDFEKAHRDRDTSSRMMTREQVARAQELSIELLRKIDARPLLRRSFGPNLSLELLREVEANSRG